jgi:hypothetical protein
MLLRDILLETPALSAPMDDDFYLSNEEDNSRRLKELLELDVALVSKINNDVSVFHAVERKHEVFFAVDKSTSKIVYYMMFETESEPLIGQFVFQSFVWLDKTCSAAIGLPKRILFGLVKQYGTVLTDSIQTWDGRDFWLRRIKDALAKGLHVYYIDFQYNRLEQLHSYEDVMRVDKQYKIWDTYGFDKRLAISAKLLIKNEK